MVGANSVEGLAGEYSGRVVVLTRVGCGACDMVKRKLERAGVDYTPIDIDTHPELVESLREAGLARLPVVKDRDGNVTAGYDPAAIRRITESMTPAVVSNPATAAPVVGSRSAGGQRAGVVSRGR